MIGIKIRRSDGNLEHTEIKTGSVIKDAIDLSLNLNPADIIAYRQVGKNLMIELADGQQVTIKGFFQTDQQSQLFLSDDGEIELVEFDSPSADGLLTVTYITQETPSEAISPLIFQDGEIAATFSTASVATSVGLGVAGVAGVAGVLSSKNSNCLLYTSPSPRDRG